MFFLLLLGLHVYSGVEVRLLFLPNKHIYFDKVIYCFSQ